MKKRLIWFILFGIAFGFIEAAVVVYLRKLYYPSGFSFPVIIAASDIARVEILREIATIILIWSAAELTAGSRLVKLAAFSIIFAVWDIFYYIFLKMVLGWPESLFTWDILFLIPYPWAGPVWAPVVISLGLIYGGVALLWADERNQALVLSMKFWFLEILMGIGIIVTFLIPGRAVINQTMPEYFPWYFFWPCFIIGLAVFIHAQFQARSAADNTPADR
ncbi:MAG: hypothetical protein KAK01_03115 [Candidatus Marinimicrobia bacterium]|nr:hypothetical protein [Candidatus Neomarinimicrobiota bacterium]